ncbi:MAG: hypothetical protein JJT76_14540 [Clostridiaceae bacterium]|nr:hypothetical protein [Clostridiaceae bacterium]
MQHLIHLNNKLIKNVFELEQQFAFNNYLGKDEGSNFKYRKGNIPIIISAPHAVKQIRNGKIKNPEIFTGSLALLLGDITDCHVIYRTFTGNGDSNKDMPCEYKNFLLEKIKEYNLFCLIDLHGLNKKRDLMIDVGTLNGISITENIKNIIINSFKEHAVFDVRFDHIFNADRTGTVVRTAWYGVGISSFQLEINGIYRDINYTQNWNNFNKIIKSLQLLIINLYKLNTLNRLN